MKNLVLNAIDFHADEIIGIGDDLLGCPELGYREEKTSAKICEAFECFGIPYEKGMAITGVKGTLKGQGDGPHICIIGELDAVPCAAHPFADKESGAAHACGHNAQLTAMLGAAIGIKKSGVLDKFPGTVSFFAVPAEEYIDLDYRRSLRDAGKIKYFGGKQQLVYEGAFDDIDIAMMVHAQPNTPEPAAFIHGGSLGFVEKQITFKGKAAHASEPFTGVNALNAAALAILGMHTNRERFREADKIRVHPIITKGGDVVNTVPDEVCMDSYVRGANFAAIRKASEDTDRAIMGAAAMVGATAEIKTQTGYFPLQQDKALGDIFGKAASEFIPEANIYSGIDMIGSSDIGDISQLMPCIQPTIGGFDGALHSKEFTITDKKAAYITPAKILALTVVELLQNDAKLGKDIIENFKPLMTKEEYLEVLSNK